MAETELLLPTGVAQNISLAAANLPNVKVDEASSSCECWYCSAHFVTNLLGTFIGLTTQNVAYQLNIAVRWLNIEAVS